MSDFEYDDYIDDDYDDYDDYDCEEPLNADDIFFDDNHGFDFGTVGDYTINDAAHASRHTQLIWKNSCLAKSGNGDCVLPDFSRKSFFSEEKLIHDVVEYFLPQKAYST